MASPSARDKENKDYLFKEVNHILEPMMLEIVKTKPENQVYQLVFTVQLKFMVKYIADTFGERALCNLTCRLIGLQWETSNNLIS